MPEPITVKEFLAEVWEDYNSPTTSTFVARLGHCRSTVAGLEEILDSDRSALNKMKKSTKALYSSGNSHVYNEAYLAENLERLGNGSLKDNEIEIGAAFLKFAVVTKELSALMKNMMQNLNNILMFPLDAFLKGDFHGVKGDLKKPFDKASKDYDNKYNKIEKEKKQLAKDAGFIHKTEFSGPEIAEEMEKERRMFQLQMCDYLIKVNEIKTKKGIDLLQHLIEYYHAQHNFFQDGLKTIEHFRTYIEEVVHQLSDLKHQQDQERRQLMELRDSLKSSMAIYREPSAISTGYSIHQLQGNKAHGFEKSGHLLKKSDGKMRKVWQRRKCIIKDGILSISHSDITKEPVKLNLLTCQVKLVPDDPGKKCFDLISSSKNRTYHFQADDASDMEEWISVLNNAKEQVLLKAFGESSGETSTINHSVKELTRTIIQEVRRMPGNKCCCDCSAPDPEWLSVNLGVLICLECCGVHRELGVHVSRTQSVIIDDLGMAQLLLARMVGNRLFNDVMEATLDPKYKPVPTCTMEEKKAFIRAKYEGRRFAIVTCTDLADRQLDLKQAILARDLAALVQVYAEGIDFMQPLPEMESDETALHLAIQQEDGTSLHMVNFIIQNSNNQTLNRATLDGNTALHLCVMENKTECMKLLLRVQPDLINYENDVGLTALEIARNKKFNVCVELLNHAIAGKSELFENVNVDWDLIQEELLLDTIDYSDDDLDGIHTPDRKFRSRPGSLVLPSESSLPLPHYNHRERSHTADSLKFATLPVPPPKPKAPGNETKPHQLNANIPTVVSGTGTLKKKAPAPPPPTYMQSKAMTLGHNRNTSDPGLQGSDRGHIRTPSDPARVTAKVLMNPGFKPALTGAKFVLPPPPEFRNQDSSKKPPVAPRPIMQKTGSVSSDVSVASAPEAYPPHPPPHGGDYHKLPPGGAPPPHPPLPLIHQPPDLGVPCRITDAVPSTDSSSRPGSGDSLDMATNGRDALGSTDSCSSHSSSDLLDPTPNPRSHRKKRTRRCQTIFPCKADNEDELSFEQGEVIVVTGEEEEEWWEGYMESDPDRRGVFPTTFVKPIVD